MKYIKSFSTGIVIGFHCLLFQSSFDFFSLTSLTVPSFSLTCFIISKHFTELFWHSVVEEMICSFSKFLAENFRDKPLNYNDGQVLDVERSGKTIAVPTAPPSSALSGLHLLCLPWVLMHCFLSLLRDEFSLLRH